MPPLSVAERALFRTVALNLFTRSEKTLAHLQADPLASLAKNVFQLADSIWSRNIYTPESQMLEYILRSDTCTSLANDWFGDFGMHLLCPECSEREFIMGSLPICRFSLDRHEVEQHRFGPPKRPFEFVLPLAPSLALAFAGARDSSEIIRLPDQLIDKINHRIFIQSYAVAARSEQEILRLLSSN